MAAQDFKGENIRLDGAAAMDRVLREMPKKVARKALNNAVLAGAGVIRKAALANLGGVGGRRAIVTANVRASEHSITRRVGIHKDRWYLSFREFGTKPHIIRNKSRSDAKLLANPETGQIFGSVVEHPGQRQRPFLRPAFDGNAIKAIDVIGKRLGDNIEKEATKLAGRFSKSGLGVKRGRR